MRIHPRRLWATGLAMTIGVGAATMAVAILEDRLAIPNASAVYLVAVTAVAVLRGVPGAIATAIVGILVYDLLFTEPRLTLTVADPGEWLHLVLMLFVAVAVGQLAAVGRRRADAARASERETRALLRISRAIAERGTPADAMPEIVGVLGAATGLARVWVVLGEDDASARVVAATDAGPPPAPGRAHHVLHVPVDVPPRWTLVRPPGADPRPIRDRGAVVRVRIGPSGGAGSIWGETPPGGSLPDESATQLLRVAADLLAQALERERLAARAREAELARQQDVVKSALLASVSHNLRTPLASIRASAGTLMDPEVVLDDETRRASASSIDREAQRLSRLVANLLDLGRIDAGALAAVREVVELDDAVRRAAAQAVPDRDRHRIEVDLAPGGLVVADPVLLEEALINLLDNAVRHTPPDALIRVRSRSGPAERVRTTIEDAGPGVPEPRIATLFDAFRPGATGPRRDRTRGVGIGLAVVRGFVDAMGGTIAARRSELGGLAVDIELPAAGVALFDPTEPEVSGAPVEPVRS